MSGEADQVKWRGVRPVDGIRGVWPARNATRVNENGYIVNSGETIVYTVAAGKKLFIDAATLSSMYTGSGTSASKLYARNGDDVEQYRVLQNYVFGGTAVNAYGIYGVALEVDEDWDVVVDSNKANLQSRGFLFGWLEDM